jgi:hypothetical protein
MVNKGIIDPTKVVRIMAKFKCPYYPAEYELTVAHLSFQQRSYASCQVCKRTMYSWSSRNLPLFALVNQSKDATSLRLP